MGSEREDDLSTELRPSIDQGATTAPAFEVIVTDGPDQGKRFPLDGSGPSRVLIGQSPSCEILLTDRAVSRRHAAFHHTGEREVRLVDLGSRNGTEVNGVRIVEVFLRGGEVIRVGGSALRLELVEESRRFTISSATGFGRLVGSSVEMRRLYPIFERIAGSNVPVVIEGETGTGKEVLAESLHEAGPRAGKPFVVFDCTSVAPSLIESELFGHERGAFTGAVSTRRGVFELADSGTLFIDEIGDLPLALQPKLLRAVQRGEVRRIGGDKVIPVDVRIISATRRDLDAEVSADRFRDDLFFRLAVTRVELPPLRSRIGDVAVLAQHFWKELGGGDRGLPYDVLRRCETYSWPGNVRELHNEIARRIALGELEHAGRAENISSAQAGGDAIEAVLALDLPLVRAREKVLDNFLARYVERVVAKHGGNVTRAAAASGVAHRYFQIIRARTAK